MLSPWEAFWHFCIIRVRFAWATRSSGFLFSRAGGGGGGWQPQPHSHRQSDANRGHQGNLYNYGHNFEAASDISGCLTNSVDGPSKPSITSFRDLRLERRKRGGGAWG